MKGQQDLWGMARAVIMIITAIAFVFFFYSFALSVTAGKTGEAASNIFIALISIGVFLLFYHLKG